MSWMSSSLRLPSNEGMIPLRPVKIVERTSSSVADLPLGRNLRSKTPCRSGGTFSRSSLLRLWQPLQCIAKRSFPRAIAFARRPSESHPDDPCNRHPRAKSRINGLRVAHRIMDPTLRSIRPIVRLSRYPGNESSQRSLYLVFFHYVQAC